ncbi:type I glutamate--ammonia ligase [Flindersiella endophytica]
MSSPSAEPSRPQAEQLADRLEAKGVRAVALTFVDNAGITRVKTVPVRRLPHAVRWGVGMSPVFDVFLPDDSITTSTHIGGPVGDLRLYPDLIQLATLAAQPGWAWAPADRRQQDGSPYAGCQRTFAKQQAEAAVDRKLTFRMAYEIEWIVGQDGPDGSFVPAATGPAYGMTRIVELSNYCRDLMDALARQDVPVEQFHPEYVLSQFELSVGASDPVTAADRVVLVRQTIQAVSQAHGLKASFAPVLSPDLAGSGMHLHVSMWSGGRNLLAGGPGPYGMTERGESLLAALLRRLPALSALGAPSVPGRMRLLPGRWAGPYQCWGRENREAGLRFVTGTSGNESQAANVELKCVDGSANPYLVAGAVMAVSAAVTEGSRLPDEYRVDPASLPAAGQPPRLPETVEAACSALEQDDVLCSALGEPLLQAFLAVRRAEVQLYAEKEPAEIAAATRWIY